MINNSLSSNLEVFPSELEFFSSSSSSSSSSTSSSSSSVESTFGRMRIASRSLYLSKKRRWSVGEEYELMTAVKEYGLDWGKIVQYFPGRNVYQLRYKWKYMVSTGQVSWDNWSASEKNKLNTVIKVHGLDWSKIVKYFPKRNVHQLRRKWETMVGSGEVEKDFKAKDSRLTLEI